MRYIKLSEEYDRIIEVQEEVVKYRVSIDFTHLSSDPLLVEEFNDYDKALVLGTFIINYSKW